MQVSLDIADRQSRRPLARDKWIFCIPQGYKELQVLCTSPTCLTLWSVAVAFVEGRTKILGAFQRR